MRIIYGMSKSRDAVIRRFKKLASTLNDHIIKCVVYKDSTGDLDHWCKELANFIYMNNNQKLKCNNTKPPTAYLIQRTLFDEIGDGDVYDARSNLAMFQYDYRQQYPEFKITDDLAQELSDHYIEFMNTFLPILSTLNDYTLEDFQGMCRKIFEV